MLSENPAFGPRAFAMPRGEGQKGKRRPRYKPSRESAQPQVLDEIRLRDPLVPGWDRKHYDEIFNLSPLADDAIKRHAAERATELHCALREMHGRILGTEEQANRAKYTVNYRKWLEFLKLGGKVKDDDEEL
jgi:hypothetical protein